MSGLGSHVDQLRPVLIFEPNGSGHRPYYVRLLVDHLKSESRRVIVVTTAEARATAEWHAHLWGIEPSNFFEIDTPDLSLRGLHDLADSADAIRVVVPDGDRFVAPLARHGWRGRSTVAVLVMRPDASGEDAPPVRAVLGVAKKLAIWAAGVRRGAEVFALRSPLQQRRWPIHWVADPVTLRRHPPALVSVRRRLESAGDRYWVGVFGAIDPRKHLHVIAEALQGVDGIGLAIVGLVSADAESLAEGALMKLTELGVPVVRWDDAPSDDEFDAAIQSVDCVVVGQFHEGSSGVTSKAAAAGRRIVLAGANSLRRDAASIPGQAEWVALTAEGIRAGVLAAMRSQNSVEAPLLGSDDFVRALS